MVDMVSNSKVAWVAGRPVNDSKLNCAVAVRSLKKSLSIAISESINQSSKHLKGRLKGTRPYKSGSNLLSRAGKRERWPFSGLTCTILRIKWPKEEQKWISNIWLMLSETQIQVPEFNGAVDLSCRAPPGANLVCPCEIYLAPGLPMWEILAPKSPCESFPHTFSSCKGLLRANWGQSGLISVQKSSWMLLQWLMCDPCENYFGALKKNPRELTTSFPIKEFTFGRGTLECSYMD